jgi:tRNA U34 5-methylaminomethyl-2-thiouridine-forming methyltransferase MnmC
MKRQIIITKDGSHTIEIPEMRVAYHSHNGAVQESMHVFIKAGLRWWLSGATGRAKAENTSATGSFTSSQTSKTSLCIFEMGFGTGLNAYLTTLEAEREQIPIHYTAVEKFPLKLEEVAPLNYGVANKPVFQKLHACPWETDVAVNPYFTLHKHRGSLQDFTAGLPFDIIYFDAFAPTAQPELWTDAIFSKLFGMLNPGGILVTYCSKTVVRRAMQAGGFTVTKIQGPRGKREMVRAIRSKES